VEVPDYPLPLEAIAQEPVEPRHAARLLVALDPDGGVCHRTVADLPALLGPGDLLVLNTTRVLPARLSLTKATGGAAEVLLLEPYRAESPESSESAPGEASRVWAALVRPGRRLPPGTVLEGGGRAVVEVGEAIGDGARVVRFVDGSADVTDQLAALGRVPLPPYIHRPLGDPERYQTVYAERPASVAAPTAGLHLTHEVLDGCRANGCGVATVDLAVGLATFKPVWAARAEDHLMHAEHFQVPAATLEACRTARRVVAVGTTTVRALESAAANGRRSGSTSLYIHGDYPFRVVDVLLTNFHQPRSSLLLLLEAFCGPSWRDLYRVALERGYRFLSFGDAMLVGRRQGSP
jgi:S-adenosylmethionine:tRNA ribosyltransferase-isomerase